MKSKKTHARNELKFVISEHQARTLQMRLEGLLPLDPHTDTEKGHYGIRSLYFDDLRDSCLHHNEFSLGRRKKYRIRTYGDSTDFFVLEKKEKQNSLSKKTSCVLTDDEYEKLCTGRVGGLYWESEKPLVKELVLAVMRHRFAPKVIIRYERTAFVHIPGNVRVTLDRNISASYDLDRFRSNTDRPIPVQEAGRHVLEVKFDVFLPSYIKQLIQLDSLEQATFSKYYLGRMTSKNHGGI